jgi:hypothetical protein
LRDFKEASYIRFSPDYVATYSHKVNHCRLFHLDHFM